VKKKKANWVADQPCGLNFGTALRALKRGYHVARNGWNGMYLYLTTSRAERVKKGTSRRFEPCIVMCTAEKRYQPGWLASQADMLADDWCILGLRSLPTRQRKKTIITNYAGGRRP
jgi:hypothetical protein